MTDLGLLAAYMLMRNRLNEELNPAPQPEPEQELSPLFLSNPKRRWLSQD